LPQAALLYRLCADPNPLHADPATARAAGFDRPILHGLCTYGVAARALIEGACGNDPNLLHGLDARFSAPVFPGETLRTEIWRGETSTAFRCLVKERNVVVIASGVARVGQRERPS
jgi:acyl dehydratase